MIHQLLDLTRPLYIFDTETTGTDPATDRIVEIGFQQWTAEGMTKEYRTLVNPGIPIPASATKVHGITDERVQACKNCGGMKVAHCDEESLAEWRPILTFKQLAENLAKGFTNCDFGGQNVRFDLQITAAEMQRAGVAWNYAGARIIDSGRLEALAVPRSLSHLHEKYAGAKHDGAHGALSDVRASTTVIAGQLQAHAILPRNLDALHKLQWPGRIDVEGKFAFVDGVPCITFGKHRNRPMQDVPRDYWDWLLKSDFSAEVKLLAGRAKLGQFPVEEV